MNKQLLVYKSSAGSGKTTQIVIEYLGLVIPKPQRYQQILAITFTNKAAEEMKSRIVTVLQMLASENYDSAALYKAKLIERGVDESLIAQNAAIVLKRILHDYSNFAVSTIDSLMHRIIRSFSFDLKLSQRFEVILDQEELIQQAVDLILDNLQPKQKLTGFLVEFVKAQTDDSRSWRIDRALYTFAKVLQNDDTIDFIDDIRKLELNDFVEAAQSINTFNADFERFMDQKAKDAFEAIGNIPVNAFPHGRSGVYGYFKKIRDKKYRESDGLIVFVPNSHANKFFEDGKLYSAKASAEDISRIDQIAGLLNSLKEDVLAYAEERGQRYSFLQLFLRNIHGMAVLKEIESQLTTLKNEQDYIHISEFNRRIAKEIQANSSVAFIYERIGEKYLHCFVDEFQDTSVLQWHNLLPLVDNGLAYNEMNMLVGDAKQSIYRWRGGEVEQFAMLPQLYQQERMPEGPLYQQTIQNHFNEKILNTNYRTAKTVVEFNNKLFEYIKRNTNSKVEEIYRDHEQLPFRDMHGKVSVEFVDGKGEELERCHLEATQHAVEQSIADGFAMKDIAVLCRSKDKGMKVAKHLSEKGYSVISSDSLLLSSAAELHFIAGILKLIANPVDELARLEVMAYLHQHHADEASFHAYFYEIKRRNTPVNLMDASDAYFGLPGFSENKWEEMSLYDMAEHIIGHFKLNDPYNPFVAFFMEELLRKSRENKSGLVDFLAWWNDNKSKVSISAPEGMDAIRIYTVHKSKGLEFPVVITPFINRTAIKMTQSNMWVRDHENVPQLKGIPFAYLPTSKKMCDTVFADLFFEEEEKSVLDEVNVLYVAFTRPVSRLYAISDLPSQKSRSITTSKLLSDFLVSEGYAIQPNQPVVMEYGEYIPPKEKTTTDHAFIQEKMISQFWRKKVVIAPSSELFEGSGKRFTALQWGKLLHSTLSEVSYAHEVEKVVERKVRAGAFDPPQGEVILSKLKEVVEHPQLNRYFQKAVKVLNEHEMLSADGALLRPDRLVFDEEQLVIIDYKTGMQDEKHKHQLNEYAVALNDMGYQQISKILVYLDEEVLVIEF